MKKIISAVLILAMLLGCAGVAFAAEPTSGVFAETTSGTVLGYKWNGIEAYLGVPYATAKRFEDPQPVEPWEGVRPALVYGDVAPQHKTTQSLLNLSYVPLEMTENENCQNLNVWTRDTKPETLKPVLFWIHGGGYASGSSAELSFYQGQSLVEFADIVFVSVNHRLNYLGYLDMSAYGEQFKNSGNAGHMDLIAALEWVRDNIANFGGDPSNVTIVGQSGGGTKVTTLMGMPAARGLFCKAVALSGGSAKQTRTHEQAQAQTAQVLEYLGIAPEDAAKLQEIDYNTLYEACSAVRVSAGNVLDDEVYPTGTFEMSADIPFIVSSVFGETTSNYLQMVRGVGDSMASPENWQWWNMSAKKTEEEILEAYTVKFGEAYAEKIRDAFVKAYPNHAPAMGTYLVQRAEINPLCAAMESYGGTVYQTLCAYIYPMFDFGFATRHTSGDIPMWFHALDTINIYTAGDEENAAKVEKAMATALVNFLYTGNPSQEGLTWEPWTTESDAIMVFDVESKMGYHHDDEVMALITEANAALRNAK